MNLPSDELHAPITPQDFNGVSIHDALIVQNVIRARAARLKAIFKDKAKSDYKELSAIDMALSVYISEEVRKSVAGEAP